MSFIATQIVN